MITLEKYDRFCNLFEDKADETTSAKISSIIKPNLYNDEIIDYEITEYEDTGKGFELLSSTRNVANSTKVTSLINLKDIIENYVRNGDENSVITVKVLFITQL